MVKFNDLMVIPYNKGIYIDVSILDMPYFKNVYLDYIYIDTQDTYNNNGISKTPVYKLQVEGNQKSIKLTIKDTDLLVSSMEGTMFFVYIKIKGLPTIDVPCGLDEPVTLGVCVDTYSIYRKGLDYIKEAYNSCEIPRHFVDFILRYKAFQMCLKTRDYPLAITYWNKFNKQGNKVINSKCSCHG